MRCVERTRARRSGEDWEFRTPCAVASSACSLLGKFALRGMWPAALAALARYTVLIVFFFTPGDAQAGRPDFGGLVLGCIEAELSKQIFILRHFLKSTRFAHFVPIVVHDFSDFLRCRFVVRVASCPFFCGVFGFR